MLWKFGRNYVRENDDIYKGKGDKQDPANYRGISVLSALLKVYTGVLARRLNDSIERRGAISECRMGFRKGRRMVDNIFMLRTIMNPIYFTRLPR
jgi:hypothetical protein